jgi:hypothetical protein
MAIRLPRLTSPLHAEGVRGETAFFVPSSRVSMHGVDGWCPVLDQVVRRSLP